MKKPNFLHVAVAVIKNKQGNVLISLRHHSVHQGGLWEFPGGKVEVNETVEQALARELKEELDIFVQDSFPLIKINHQYADLNVFLDVWQVTAFSGTARGREGQSIKWVSADQLKNHTFPAANHAIITAAQLPSEYAILNSEEAQLITDLKRMLDNGQKLIQARLKTLSANSAIHFFEQAIPMCQQKGALLLINSAIKGANQIKTKGLHLTASDLLTLKQRPSRYTWLAASCHNTEELKHAEKIGVDFVVLAPVLATKTHPDATPLGWELFTTLIDSVNIPVFALGGMLEQHKQPAQFAGAQGIAGISVFLK